MSKVREWTTCCVVVGASLAFGCSDDPPPIAVISTVAEAEAGAASDAGTCGGEPSIDAQVGMAPSISGGCSSDPAGGLLEYAWDLVNAPTGSLAELHDTTLIRPTFIPDVEGKYVLSLVVTAGKRESEPIFVDVIAMGFCGVSRPIADATVTGPAGTGIPADCGGAPITVTSTVEGEILIDASGSLDPDNTNASCGLNQRLDFLWEVMATPVNAGTSDFQDPNAEIAVFRARESGSYSVRLIVTDELGFESDPITCDLDVTVPPPPP